MAVSARLLVGEGRGRRAPRRLRAAGSRWIGGQFSPSRAAAKALPERAYAFSEPPYRHPCTLRSTRGGHDDDDDWQIGDAGRVCPVQRAQLDWMFTRE